MVNLINHSINWNYASYDFFFHSKFYQNQFCGCPVKAFLCSPCAVTYKLVNFFTNKSMLVPWKVCEVYLANSLSSTHFWRYEIFANLMLMICLILSACKLLRRALLQHLSAKIQFELKVKPSFKGRGYRKNTCLQVPTAACTVQAVYLASCFTCLLDVLLYLGHLLAMTEWH